MTSMAITVFKDMLRWPQKTVARLLTHRNSKLFNDVSPFFKNNSPSSAA